MRLLRSARAGAHCEKHFLIKELGWDVIFFFIGARKGEQRNLRGAGHGDIAKCRVGCDFFRPVKSINSDMRTGEETCRAYKRLMTWTLNGV